MPSFSHCLNHHNAHNAPAILVFVPVILALVAGLSTAQTVHVVQVGRRGDSLALRFTPEDTTADVGDMVQFQFYPLNHSVAEATFDKPCVPATDDTSALGNAFWSGFHPLPTDTEILDTFTVNITSIAPIFYYCSQGRHCMQGFVGTINAGPDQLAAFKAAAGVARDSLSPGESPSAPVRDPEANDDSDSSDDGGIVTTNRSQGGDWNVAAVVGGVLGGVAIMMLMVVVVVVIIVKRRRRQWRSGKYRRRSKRRKKIGLEDVGKPVLKADSAGLS